MGWVEELHGKVVCLDTTPFISFIEKQPVYVDIVRPFFQAVEKYKITVVTSTITLLEVLVHPIRDGDTKLAQRYKDILLDSVGFSIVDVSQQIAEEASRLRAFYNLRTPDSIQMATAIHMNATYFLTNDLRLPSLPELEVLTLDEIRTRPEYLEPEDVQ